MLLRAPWKHPRTRSHHLRSASFPAWTRERRVREVLPVKPQLTQRSYSLLQKIYLLLVEMSAIRCYFGLLVTIPTMRYSARWMTIADERILEHLSEVEADTPKGMADSGRVRFTRQYIGERCQKLADYGLLRPLGNGVYRITVKGEEYLAGELDASKLEANEE